MRLGLLVALLACCHTTAFALGRPGARAAAGTSGTGREKHEKLREKHEKLVEPTRRGVSYFLYLLTAINPIMALFNNDYSRRIVVPGSPPDEKIGKGSALAGIYRTLFYFARLKPRLMYSVGAALRALQMTTPLPFIFDPPAGVGAGLNLLALASSSRWPAMLVLGWYL